MDSSGILNALNSFTALLTKTSLTQKVSELRRMCLIPFLRDIYCEDGKMRGYVTSEDKVFWDNFLSNCFSEVSFESTSPMGGNIYIGFANSLPSGNDVISQSKEYPQNVPYYVSGVVTGKYFWIAVPMGKSLSEVKNMSFAGDYIDISTFKRVNDTIHNGQYTLYYVKSLIPLRSNYQIIIR